MENFERVIVCLDNTSMDRNLIQMASFISRFESTKQIIFTHVIKSAFISKSLLNEFPTLIEDAVAERKKALQTQIDLYFDESQLHKVEFEVVEGVPVKVFLKTIAQKNVSLMIIGKNSTTVKKDTLLSQLIKKVDCSALVVPENMENFNLQKFLVPIDYSKGSHLALNFAASMIGNELKSAEIFTQNIFTVPSGYHYTGKTYEEFAVIMKQNAIQDYKNFISDLSIDNSRVKNIYTLDKNEDLMGVISNTASKVNVDAIIIGTKLRTTSSAYFSGKSAFSLLIRESNIPIFIIKQKGKNASILEYLMEI
jgi:nucleotide-binding universal stress UspA family protein